MGESLQWVMRKAVETTPRLAFQVFASVLATLCAAFISNVYLASEPQKAPPAAPAIEAGAGAHLLRANFVDDGYRVRSASVVEFADVYGLSAAKPYAPLTPAEWSMPPAVEPVVDKAVEEKLEQKRSIVAQSCVGECGRKQVASATLLPPPRPTSLTPVVAAEAPNREIESNAADDKPVQLLGMSLPGFVPSGKQVVSTVASLGDSVVGLFGLR